MSEMKGKRWQAPGNGKGFDSDFENWIGNKMSERSIGALQYLISNTNVTQKRFEKEIWQFLKDRYGHEINNSCKSHFFRPVEFFGFIRHFNNLLSVSYNGKQFVKEIENENYDKVREFFILQLFNAKYPNTATKEVKISLYPFRIIFKLFSEKGFLKAEDFEYKIPYILEAKDCYEFYLKNSNLYRRGIQNGKYVKFKTWVINSFVNLNILLERKGIYELSPLVDSFIESLIVNQKYEDMFFSNEWESNSIKNKIVVNVKRDNKVINDALKLNNYQCYFNVNHKTFETKKFNNFVEGHHIIPMGQQKSFSQNLDVVDNVIPLCPNCHRMIHLAKNNIKMEYLNKIIEKKDKLQSFSDISKEDLYEFYCEEE